MQEATNTDNIAIKDIHQQACGGSHLIFKEDKLQKVDRGSRNYRF